MDAEAGGRLDDPQPGDGVRVKVLGTVGEDGGLGEVPVRVDGDARGTVDEDA